MRTSLFAIAVVVLALAACSGPQTTRSSGSSPVAETSEPVPRSGPPVQSYDPSQVVDTAFPFPGSGSASLLTAYDMAGEAWRSLESQDAICTGLLYPGSTLQARGTLVQGVLADVSVYLQDTLDELRESRPEVSQIEPYILERLERTGHRYPSLEDAILYKLAHALRAVLCSDDPLYIDIPMALIVWSTDRDSVYREVFRMAQLTGSPGQDPFNTIATDGLVHGPLLDELRLLWLLNAPAANVVDRLEWSDSASGEWSSDGSAMLFSLLWWSDDRIPAGTWLTGTVPVRAGDTPLFSDTLRITGLPDCVLPRERATPWPEMLPEQSADAPLPAMWISNRCEGRISVEFTVESSRGTASSFTLHLDLAADDIELGIAEVDEDGNGSSVADAAGVGPRDRIEPIFSGTAPSKTQLELIYEDFICGMPHIEARVSDETALLRSGTSGSFVMYDDLDIRLGESELDRTEELTALAESPYCWLVVRGDVRATSVEAPIEPESAAEWASEIRAIVEMATNPERRAELLRADDETVLQAGARIISVSGIDPGGSETIAELLVRGVAPQSPNVRLRWLLVAPLADLDPELAMQAWFRPIWRIDTVGILDAWPDIIADVLLGASDADSLIGFLDRLEESSSGAGASSTVRYLPIAMEQP